MKKITTAFLLLTIMGCASRAPLSEQEKTDENLRQWTSKVEVFDRRQDRKHTIEMDFLAMGRERLRIDVNANFAVVLAAAVVNDGEMTAILPRDKKYYKGSANRAALARSLRMPLDPAWISALLRDQELRGDGWSCTRDGGGLLVECTQAAESRKVTWSDRSGDFKKVSISDPRYDFEFRLKEVPTKVQDVNKAFTLNVPPNYESVKP